MRGLSMHHLNINAHLEHEVEAAEEQQISSAIVDGRCDLSKWIAYTVNKIRFASRQLNKVGEYQSDRID